MDRDSRNEGLRQTIAEGAGAGEELRTILERLVSRIVELEAANEEHRAANEALRAANEALRAANERLRERVADLEERLRRSSRNSSKPPSSDPPWRKGQRKGKRTEGRDGAEDRASDSSGRGEPAGGAGKGRRGGGTLRRFGPDEVDRVVEVWPWCCRSCGEPYLGAERATGRRGRYQQAELEGHGAVVVEYHSVEMRCRHCGVTSRGPVPEEVRKWRYGPRLRAFIVSLVFEQRLSRRLVTSVVHNAFEIRISLGEVQRIVVEASEAVAEAVEEVEETARRASVIHADETPWHDQGALAWLWVMVTGSAVRVRILQRRNGEAAKELLGERIPGRLVTDRLSSYDAVEARGHQYCWAHLKRNLRALVERGGECERVGRQLLEVEKELFATWHRHRSGHLDRKAFEQGGRQLKERFLAIVDAGLKASHPRVRRMCRRLRKDADKLFQFVEHPGLEPTNNAAERAIRPAVLYRKLSFGTRSKAGRLAFERLMTVVATCRVQGRRACRYLADCLRLYAMERPPPTLVPASVTT